MLAMQIFKLFYVIITDIFQTATRLHKTTRKNAEGKIRDIFLDAPFFPNKVIITRIKKSSRFFDKQRFF